MKWLFAPILFLIATIPFRDPAHATGADWLVVLFIVWFYLPAGKSP